jgi:hypothetical protein
VLPPHWLMPRAGWLAGRGGRRGGGAIGAADGHAGDHAARRRGGWAPLYGRCPGARSHIAKPRVRTIIPLYIVHTGGGQPQSALGAGRRRDWRGRVRRGRGGCLTPRLAGRRTLPTTCPLRTQAPSPWQRCSRPSPRMMPASSSNDVFFIATKPGQLHTVCLSNLI